MIVTPRIGIRLAVIVVLAVILQVSFFSYVSLLGATPDALSVVIVSLGLLGGGVVGAVCGFCAGFLLDSVLLQTLGVSSLVLLFVAVSIAYVSGRFPVLGIALAGGGWIQLNTWLCLRFFAENEARLHLKGNS